MAAISRGKFERDFSFSSRAAKEEQSYEQTIDRNATDLLFEAIHLRDEFEELKNSMPLTAPLELEKAALSLGPSESEISRTLMEEIWRDCAEEPSTLSAFASRFPVCELKVYQAVRELIRTGHLGFSARKRGEKGRLTNERKMKPVTFALMISLALTGCASKETRSKRRMRSMFDHRARPA